MDRTALWIVAGPLIIFKIWVTILLLMYAPTRAGIEMVVVTGWPWALGFIVLVAAPCYAWYRLVKVRARRRQLLRQEWMGQPPASERQRAGHRPVPPVSANQ